MRRIIQHGIKIWSIIRSVPGYQLVIMLQLLSGMANFAGVPLLIPALKYINDRPAGVDTTNIQIRIEAIFSFLRIPLNLFTILSAIVILVVSGLLLNFAAILISHFMQYRMYADCSRRLFNLYLDVKWAWQVKHHSGEMSHALYSEVAQWSSTAFQALKILTSLIQFATFFILAVYISWISTIFVGAIFLVLMIVNIVISQIVKRNSLRKNEEQKAFAAFVNSSQQNKKFLKTSLIHEPIIRHYNKIIGLLVVLARRIVRWQQIQKLWTSIMVFLFLVMLVAFHQYLRISFEALVVLLLIFMRLMPQLNILTADYAAFSQSLPVYDSIQNRLADLSSNQESFGKQSYKDGSSLQLENITFSYGDSNEVLKGVTLEVPSRKTIAIVGGSGVGKSTILDLILGLWPPNSGELLYGEVSNKDLDFTTLRKRVAYVSQETTLFNGSLWENLTIGSPESSAEDVAKACRNVFLEKVIEDLPDGLETEIGENGIQLSGGQRQRLALGRAMLMRPDILILDEATSSLDFESEQYIQQAVNKLHQNLTIIVVTHRLSTVRDADIIYVLEEGKICESGSFENLIKKRGRFYYLNSIQSKERGENS